MWWLWTLCVWIWNAEILFARLIDIHTWCLDWQPAKMTTWTFNLQHLHIFNHQQRHCKGRWDWIKINFTFMLCPKCTKEDSYLALASKSPLLWSLHVDDDCCDRCWSYWCHWRLCIMVIAIIIDERQLQLSRCWKIQFSRALIFCTWV